nr:hypothetical protein [Tanacetum cinerariifolium]
MNNWLVQKKTALGKDESNPLIVDSLIKNSMTNDVVRLQALTDQKKVIINKDTVLQALQLDDAESIDCLPNEAADDVANVADKFAQAIEILKVKQRVGKLEKKNKVKTFGLRRLDDEPEPVELKEVIEVVTTVKLMTEVDTIAATTAASTITAAPSAARKRKGVVIRDLKRLLLHQP